MDSLKITDEQLLSMMHILEEEMSAGLNPATHAKAAVKMFPTYVRNTPRGTEIGQVLALDLGGTNFRVLLIDLRGNARVELTSKIFVIPQSIMIGDGKHVGTAFVPFTLTFFRFSYFDTWPNVYLILCRKRIFYTRVLPIP